MVEKNHNQNLSTQSIDQKRQDFSKICFYWHVFLFAIICIAFLFTLYHGMKLDKVITTHHLQVIIVWLIPIIIIFGMMIIKPWEGGDDEKKKD